MPEPKTKIIDGESFTISQPYEAGHQCTEAEAKALNQVRSENIGNNLRSAIAAAKEKREAGDSADFDNLAALVAKYDSEYTFSRGGGGGGGRTVRDPVEREALSLAREYIKGHLADKGRTMKQVPEGMTEDEWKAKLEANIEKVAASDDILKLAKKRVAEKQKVNKASFDGLLD
jgi:hypothetical protein